MPNPLIAPRLQPVIAAATVVGLAGGTLWLAVAAGRGGGLVDHDAPPAASGGFSVDINTASAVELAQLPGLGPGLAGRILAHRRDHGPFPSHESLLDVAGVGAATLERLRPYLRPISAPPPAAPSDRR